MSEGNSFLVPISDQKLHFRSSADSLCLSHNRKICILLPTQSQNGCGRFYIFLAYERSICQQRIGNIPQKLTAAFILCRRLQHFYVLRAIAQKSHDFLPIAQLVICGIVSISFIKQSQIKKSWINQDSRLFFLFTVTVSPQHGLKSGSAALHQIGNIQTSGNDPISAYGRNRP